MIFSEIADAYRFFFATPKEHKQIVFYAEHGGYYTYFEGIINKLIADNSQTICYLTSDSSDPVLRGSDKHIRSFYFRTLLPYILLVMNTRVCVMTLTDLGRFHIWRSVNPVYYIYAFHSMVSTHMIYREGAFDNYDAVLCTGPHQYQEIRKREELAKLPPKKLVAAGYYRLERIFNAYKIYQAANPQRQKNTVLIAPSWGNKNILESCGENLIKQLLGSGYHVIVRPHPEIVRRLPQLIDKLLTQFGKNPLFVLETSTANDRALFESDVLISDYSGIALEYAFGTERPVMFMDVPPKVKNENFKMLDIEPLELMLRARIGIIVKPAELDSVRYKIQELISNASLYRERIRALREQYVYNFGQSPVIAANFIINVITNKI